MIQPPIRKATSAVLLALVLVTCSALAPVAHAANGATSVAVVQTATGFLASIQAAFSGVFDFFSADVDPTGGNPSDTDDRDPCGS